MGGGDEGREFAEGGGELGGGEDGGGFEGSGVSC